MISILEKLNKYANSVECIGDYELMREVAAELMKAQIEIEKLEARIRVQDLVMNRMARTEDGLPVAQWDKVWQATNGKYANGDPVVAIEKTFVMYAKGRWEFVEDGVPQDGPIYSSFEAAELAAKSGV